MNLFRRKAKPSSDASLNPKDINSKDAEKATRCQILMEEKLEDDSE